MFFVVSGGARSNRCLRLLRPYVLNIHVNCTLAGLVLGRGVLPYTRAPAGQFQESITFPNGRPLHPFEVLKLLPRVGSPPRLPRVRAACLCIVI
jgi:hypothetical protein